MSAPRLPSVPVAFQRLDFAVTTVTSSAYTELQSDLAGDICAMYISNTATNSLTVAIGPAGSEVDTFLIAPSSSILLPMVASKHSRIAVKTTKASTSTSSGELNINYYH